MGTAKDMWHVSFNQPVRSVTKVKQPMWGEEVFLDLVISLTPKIKFVAFLDKRMKFLFLQFQSYLFILNLPTKSFCFLDIALVLTSDNFL
jgi:hypothetical protein